MNVVIGENRPVWVTPDDMKLIEALANGAKRPETALLLKIKENTMDMRLRRLRQKMKLKTNYQLVAHFVRQNWVK